MSAVLSLQVDNLMWTGQAVTGTERGGVVSYTWDGQSYTLNDAGSTRTAPHVTVYLNPASPSGAVLDDPTERGITIFMVVVPVVAAIALLALGGTREYRTKRRNAKRGTSDWWLSKIPR